MSMAGSTNIVETAPVAALTDRAKPGHAAAAAMAEMQGVPDRPVQFALKRGFDVILSFVALVVLSPLFLFLAAAIRLDSRGPVFFVQERWGRGGSIIRVVKFRSMHVELCDPTGISQTRENDPRITRVGAILRRTNLDELPQLFNILMGDMSLVGPRCHVVGMLACGKPYEEVVAGYHRRHAVRPGLTGLAQMRGFRGPTDTEYKARVRVALDMRYIDNLSLFLDLKIIAGTIINEIRGGKGF